MKISIIGRLVGGYSISAMFILFIGGTLLLNLHQNEVTVRQYEQVIIPGLDEVANLNVSLLTVNKVINQMAGSLNHENFPTFQQEVEDATASFASSEQFLRKSLETSPEKNKEWLDVLNQASAVANEVFGYEEQVFTRKTNLLDAEFNRSKQYDSFVGEWLFFDGDMGSLMDELNTESTRDVYWTVEYIVKQGNSASISINSLGSVRNLEELSAIQKKLLDYVNNISTKMPLLKSQAPSFVSDIQYYLDVLDSSVNDPAGLYFMTQEGFIEREALAESLIEIGSDVNAAQNLLEKLAAASREHANALSKEVVAASKKTKAMSILILVVSAVLGFILAIDLVRSIRSPLVKTVSIIEQLAGGDFTNRLTGLKQDEFGRIGDSVNRLADELSQILKNILDSSVSVADFADASNQTSINTRQRTEDQKEQTELVATAVTEMETAIQEVARNAENTASEVNEVNDLAVTNKKNMDDNIAQIRALNGNLISAGAVVDTLNNESNNIGSILEVIRGIAEQTNLLALNAAIEAARAGEHGRGFAVVADEVRNLANKTQQSTEEIDSMIGSLQANAGQASSLMQQNQELANQCAEQSTITGVALESMLQNLSQIRGMSASIATASEEQGAVAREVSQMIVAIASLAEDLSADAEMATDKSAELKLLAYELNKLVGNFTISL